MIQPMVDASEGKISATQNRNSNCREKAIAVCQGLAEPAMCLPYLVEELEETCARLEQSHAELDSAQRRLLETERLASMGQLSAGVAHEINNPLAIINEKAGLIKDKLTLSPELPTPDALMPLVNSVLSSVDRCKTAAILLE